MEKIIFKYLHKTLSDEETVQLEKWLEIPANPQKFMEYIRLNNDLNASYTLFDKQGALTKINTRLFAKTSKQAPWFPNLLKYAAVLIGFMIAGYGIYWNSSKNTTPETTPQITLQLEDGSLQTVDPNANSVITNSSGRTILKQQKNQLVYDASADEEVLRYNTLSIPYGKTFGITLSDGSKVTLNAGSELRYPVNFIAGEKNREVFLKGEAFFEIASDTVHPFIVTTKELDVQVLGTRFNVTAYPEDAKTLAVLVEGKVSVQNKLRQADVQILQPGEGAFLENNKVEVQKVNVQKYVGWVSGQLVFADDPFKVITHKLERRYNVSIKNNYEPLEDIRITATFESEDIAQVLKTFQTYKPFNYTIENNIVTISAP